MTVRQRYDSRKLDLNQRKLPLSCPHVRAKLGAVKSPTDRAITGLNAPQVGAAQKPLFHPLFLSLSYPNLNQDNHHDQTYPSGAGGALS